MAFFKFIPPEAIYKHLGLTFAYISGYSTLTTLTNDIIQPSNNYYFIIIDLFILGVI